MNETIISTFNVIFHLRHERERQDRLPIYARITINGKRIELSVKQMMNPLHWNERRGTAEAMNAGYAWEIITQTSTSPTPFVNSSWDSLLPP